VALPKSREALIRVPIKPRSEGNTLTIEFNPLNDPETLVRPGTYRQALIMATNKKELFNTQFFIIIPLTQAFPETMQLSRDLTRYSTVLCCMHGATGRSKE
jgi:hypothetical protein